MKLVNLKIQNYRALKEIEIPLSRFGCLIGKNNAGKSTILQALSLFFSGTKLSSKDFYNPANPIRIEIRFEEIGPSDIERLSEEHRERIQGIINDGKLTLVRFYDTTGSSSLLHVAMIPNEPRFKADSITTLTKGKKTAGLLAAFIAEFPELEEKFTASTINITKAKEAIAELAATLPDESKQLADCELPTGIDASVKAFLPDPIYIAAVKNLADDVKAKESTPFGKVLSILLDAIEPQLGDVKRFFHELSQKFNRIPNDDGSVSDDRYEEVKLIEQTVESYLKECFSNVTLEINIPPPELKTILSSAEMFIDDGIRGSIESKGDGLRRAAVFSILRTYVKLSQSGGIAGALSSDTLDRHILLFEEPELYLHPSAQKVLFDALSVFSERNHVMITTHSPSFFGPDATASFVKLSKVSSAVPYTEARPVNLGEIDARDQFQLICFDNNNAAFFYDSVVLVEGDSDYVVLPHIAKHIAPNWATISSRIKFVRINGKGSIQRYKKFFDRFGVKVAVVTDLDLIINGFEKINPSEALRTKRSALIASLDRHIESNGGFSEPTNKTLKAAQQKTELIRRWKRAKEVHANMVAGTNSFDDLNSAVEDFFSWERNQDRLIALCACDSTALKTEKRAFLKLLRTEHVYVLEKGDLESYYPSTITTQEKPRMAQAFCNEFNTRDGILGLCDDHTDGETTRKEFELIFDGLCSIGV